MDTIDPRPGDLIELILDDGEVLYMEAIKGKKKQVKFVCLGEVFELDREQQLTSDGFYPRISEPWVKSNAFIVSCFNEVRKIQKSGEMQLPSLILEAKRIESCNVVTTMSMFEMEVQSNPGLWCDGTGPNDTPLNVRDQSLLTAGELVALLEGQRGVALLQMCLPGDMGGKNLPLLRPFVCQILKRLAESKDVVMYPSTAAQGAAKSLVIAAKCQPYISWGKYLSSLGVQASLVADSEFYKYIIGKMMGYKDENIEHHIKSSGGMLTKDITDMVQKELDDLSAIAPHIPWR